jgi:hypothetical protein
LGALRIHGLRILLYPVVILLFLLGWVLHVVGERQADSEEMSKRKINDSSFEASTSNDDEVEFGLIDEYLKSNS